MANRKINELSVRTPSLTDLMIVGDPSTGYSFKATLAALNTLIDSSTSIGDLSGVVITSPTNGQALVYNGTNWVNQSISVPVTSVFGRTGAVVATEGDYSLDLLSDVTLTTPSSNQVLQYNGTAWVNATLTDNGITSLNGLTALSQTFATGSSGTDFAISSTTSTHTFNLPTASAVNRGALSSADWSTFNSKVGGSGTSGQVAYWTGTSSQSGSSTFLFSPTSELDLANSVTASGAIARGGRIRPTLTAAANNDVLVGLDISPTFTNGAFTGVRNFGLRVTTGNAVEAARFTSPSGQFLIMPRLSSIYGAYLQSLDAAGTATQPLSFSSNKFVFESGNVLINQTTDGGQRLQVNGDAIIVGSGTTSSTRALYVRNSTPTDIFTVRNDGAVVYGGASVGIYTSTDRGQTINTGAGALFIGYFAGGDLAYASAPAVTIGRPSNRLLNGTSGTQTMGSVVGNYSPTSGTGLFTTFEVIPTINQTGGANGITRGLYVNPTLTAAADWRSIEWSNNSGWGLYGAGTANSYFGGSVGIGATSLAESSLRLEKNITGATVAYGILNRGIIQSDVTSEAYYNRTFSRTAAASFTLSSIYHYVADQALIGAGSTVTNQYGFVVQSSVTGATNNYGFYGNIASGTGRWNIYMSGTAANYMNGNLLLGSTTDGGQKLQVTGTAAATVLQSRVVGGNNEALAVYSNTNQQIWWVQAQGNFPFLNIISGQPFQVRIGGGIAMAVTLTDATFAGGARLNIPFSSSAPTSGAQVEGWLYYDTTLKKFRGRLGNPLGIYGDIHFSNGANVFNEDGGDFDTRIEGDTNQNLFFVDASVDNIGMGTNTPNASALLDISSTTKGFLPPRMTNAQMVAIGTPASGLMVYDTTNNKLNVYDGTNWVAVH